MGCELAFSYDVIVFVVFMFGALFKRPDESVIYHWTEGVRSNAPAFSDQALHIPLFSRFLVALSFVIEQLELRMCGLVKFLAARAW